MNDHSSHMTGIPTGEDHAATGPLEALRERIDGLAELDPADVAIPAAEIAAALGELLEGSGEDR